MLCLDDTGGMNTINTFNSTYIHVLHLINYHSIIHFVFINETYIVKMSLKLS